MEPSIHIKNRNGDFIGKTFPKRAKQLILKQKAWWLNEEQTELCVPEGQEEELEKENALDNTQKIKIVTENNDILEDYLYAVAKKHVKQKDIYLCHGLFYIGSIFVLFLLELFDFFGYNHNFTVMFFLINTLAFVAHAIYWGVPKVIRNIQIGTRQLNKIQILYEVEILKAEGKYMASKK